jgi:hypothetical protein
VRAVGVEEISMSTQAKVGDIVNIRTFSVRGPNGRRQWFWMSPPDHKMSDEEAFLTQQHHGPFNSEEEADRNSELVMLGAQCEITDGGMWDPAWDKPQ